MKRTQRFNRARSAVLSAAVALFIGTLFACQPALVASRPSGDNPLIGAWLSQDEANRRIVVFDPPSRGCASGQITTIRIGSDGSHSTSHGWFQELNRISGDFGRYALLAESIDADPVVVTVSLAGGETVRLRYRDLTKEEFARVPDPRISMPLAKFNPIVGTWRSLNRPDTEAIAFPAGTIFTFSPKTLG
ncbi:MAG: hypothetical protein KAU31_01525, partial [Spirochaetaceae bacterium]|nr:hypothetical protein [Spirochaetaceae bacterium]